jgi:hypothetical protein
LPALRQRSTPSWIQRRRRFWQLVASIALILIDPGAFPTDARLFGFGGITIARRPDR